MGDVTLSFTEEMAIPPDDSGISITDSAGNTLTVSTITQPGALTELLYSGPWTPADPVPGVDSVTVNYSALTGDLQSLVGYAVGSFSGDVPACGNATNFDLDVFSETRIDLEWIESQDDPSVTYELFRDSVSIQTFPYGTMSYSDTGLDPDTRYDYELHTLYAGNSIGSISGWTRTFASPVLKVFSALSTRMFSTFDLQQTLSAPMNRAVPEFNTARFDFEQRAPDAVEFIPGDDMQWFGTENVEWI